MSFTTDVIEEILNVPEGKTCCRKAMLYGLFMGANEYGIQNRAVAELKTYAAAERASAILKKCFSANAEPRKIVRAGRERYSVEVVSKALNNFLVGIDGSDKTETIAATMVGFRCGECAISFLRGVFISCATVNDPTKGYHLEFMFPSEKRAYMVAQLLQGTLFECSVRLRNKRYGMVFQNNSSISDILCYLGATQMGFSVANVYIEKNIINCEKRATNCDTKNIARSIEATRKHIEAIEYLQSSGAILNLDPVVRDTARLRLENPSASLNELALMHKPSITKSGLNARLSKIIALYNDEKNKK